MSSYVNFYLKKDNTWAALADFNRSTHHYEVIEHIVPYEELVPLTDGIMNEVFANISENLQILKTNRESHLKEIEIIASMPNPVEEKLEAIDECRSSIEWEDKAIESLEEARSFYSVINEIRSTGKWLYKTDEYVWAGIEAGPSEEE